MQCSLAEFHTTSLDTGHRTRLVSHHGAGEGDTPERVESGEYLRDVDFQKLTGVQKREGEQGWL